MEGPDEFNRDDSGQFFRTGGRNTESRRTSRNSPRGRSQGAVQKYGQPTQPEGVCVFLYSLAGWVPVAQTPENRSLILRAREMVCLIVDNRQGEENYWSV